jgi:hypothetical protein
MNSITHFGHITKITLKGQCHEMNNFFESNQYFLYRRQRFFNFLHLNCPEKYFFLSSCLLLYENTSNSEYFTGSRIRISPTPLSAHIHTEGTVLIFMTFKQIIRLVTQSL